MKQPAPLFISLLAAALLASCSSSDWGHATVRTKHVQPPASMAPPPAPPAPAAAIVKRAVAKPVMPAPKPLLAPAAQPSPIAAPAPNPLVPKAHRPTPPQNNPRLHRKSYPTMPGQNRGLQSIYSQRGY